MEKDNIKTISILIVIALLVVIYITGLYVF